ncbi:MAG: hypothetical protein SGILL_006092 [Bacillariaceae sp.]
MKFSVPNISITASVAELAQCIERSDGLLVLEDLPVAPFDDILALLQNSSDVTARLNQASKVPIYNDSNSEFRPGSRLQSIDLSPKKLETMAQVDPDLINAPALSKPMEFYKAFQDKVNQKLLPALAFAIGTQDLHQDVVYSYRMLDYYPNCNEKHATVPRLAEHRDFGFLTLIQATHPGLQIKRGKRWHPLPAIPRGAAWVVFGWCAHVRSNGRIPASLHRVTKHTFLSSRVAAILFAMPASGQTLLEPVLKGEPRTIRSGITADDLQQQITRSESQQQVENWLTAPSTTAPQTKKKKSGWSRVCFKCFAFYSKQ